MKKGTYIGYGQGACGQYIAVKGTYADCREYMRTNTGKSCTIRKALVQEASA